MHDDAQYIPLLFAIYNLCVVSFFRYIYIYGLFIHLKATVEIAKFSNTSLKVRAHSDANQFLAPNNFLTWHQQGLCCF